MEMSSISLHLSLSHPNFAVPPNMGVNYQSLVSCNSDLCSVHVCMSTRTLLVKAKQKVNKSTTPKTTLFPRKKEKLP